MDTDVYHDPCLFGHQRMGNYKTIGNGDSNDNNNNNNNVFNNINAINSTGLGDLFKRNISDSDFSSLLFPQLSNNFNYSICANRNAERPMSTSLNFYVYVTPALFVIGILGNVLSLKVFLSRNMRKLSASAYLSALSVSDLSALIFYVLVDWLRRGLPHLGGSHSVVTVFDVQGLCQVQMYLSYVTRFVSAWIIVTFTVERYIGVCHPLKRRSLCVSRSAHKVLVVLISISLVIMLYKPILTGRFEHEIHHKVIGRCSRNPSHPMLSFVLDSVFAIAITLVPFFIISVLNTLIIRRFCLRYRRKFRSTIVTAESIVRMEFTVIFLVISFVFVALNLPYFCFWFTRFLRSFYKTTVSNGQWEQESESMVMVARLTFYLNYSINFFLYSITGAYFRKELRMMFAYRKYNNNNNGCSRLSNNSNLSNHSTPQSWVYLHGSQVELQGKPRGNVMLLTRMMREGRLKAKLPPHF